MHTKCSYGFALENMGRGLQKLIIFISFFSDQKINLQLHSSIYMRPPSGFLFRWSKMKIGSLVHHISKIQLCHISTIIVSPDARLTQNENDNTTTTRDITTILCRVVMALHKV